MIAPTLRPILEGREYTEERHAAGSIGGPEWRDLSPHERVEM